jgi:hypothetical protein
MPRAAEPQIRLVPLAEVLAALGGISEDTFRRHWQGVFTDRRTDGSAGGKKPRLVYSDELAAAVEHGPAAVELLRRTKGRL